MKYNQPYDQPDNPDAKYINGDTTKNIQGSTVPGAGVEYDQREIVEVISRANSRHYTDFSNIPCATPGNYDLTQLRKAIEGFIKGWAWFIDTYIVFHVHGAGADFPDLHAAMAYLRRFYITTNGFVVLQLAGAPYGSGQAARYVYYGPIIFEHENNNRIAVVGAPMLKPASPRDDAYQGNGNDPTTRYYDTQWNLAYLRQCFATELFFVGGIGGSSETYFQSQGIILYKAPALAYLDGILLTSDGTGGGIGIGHYGVQGATGGMVPGQTSVSGLACIGFGYGMLFELGSTCSYQGVAYTETASAPMLLFGNAADGMALGDGSYFSIMGNLVTMGNGQNGLTVWPRGGVQMDGAVHARCNASVGAQLGWECSVYIYGPIAGGTPYEPSRFWQNGQWGIWAHHAMGDIYADCAEGTGYANGAGSIFAEGGSSIGCTAGDYRISSRCSPPWNTVGNNNAMIY